MATQLPPKTHDRRAASAAPSPQRYRVFIADRSGGRIRTGPAEAILRHLKEAATRSEIEPMSVEQYARTLVDDAGYFMAKPLLDSLERWPFPTIYDRALRYLAEMPSSGVRLLDLLPEP